MRVLSVVSLFTLLSGPVVAAPVVFDFANLKYNGSTNSGFLPTDGIACSGGDLCSSNIASSLSGDLSFTNGGLTVHAQGSYKGGDFGSKAAVVQDHENGYNGLLSGTKAIGAGLGVYHKKDDTSDDNITEKEAIWLHFDQNVSLSSVGFRAEGHNTTGWDRNATFQYSFDNSTWTSGLLPRNVGQFALSHTGHDFYFRYGGAHADQFYISSMTVSAVPEPETYAMLLIGLGLVSFSLRSKKG
jgi:hypothetical protein